MGWSSWHDKSRSSSHNIGSLSLRRLRSLFRTRRKPLKESQVAEEKPRATTYQHVPKHAASSHLATASPMTIRQRMPVVPGGRASPTGSQSQPTRTLAEQAEEMRARGRQRGDIVVGGTSERCEVSSPLHPFKRSVLTLVAL